MNKLLIGILGLFLAVNLLPSAIPPLSAQAEPVRQDLVEQQYLKLLADDDAAQEEADQWIKELQAAESEGKPISRATLAARIEQRFASVRKAYDDFLRRNPDHVRARIAYGSFLHDTGEEKLAVAQWERAKELDPKNPAIWNNLANYYGHRGPVKKAFEHYAKAIELDPEEPVYLQNLATTVYLFRKDAREYYEIEEQEVFNRALELYRKARELDPENFPLATDYAQSYYGIRPPRVEAAISAWEYALKVANDDIEREGVHVHLARVKLNAGRFEEARSHLDKVSHDMYTVLKDRVSRNLNAKEKETREKEDGAKPAEAEPTASQAEPEPESRN